MDKPQIKKGFDRGIDFIPIKEKLLKEITCEKSKLDQLYTDYNVKNFHSKERIIICKLIYLTISCIQLRNGSRISEAIQAFKLFFKNRKIDFTLVKIAKSEKKSYKITKKNGDEVEKKATPPRYRNIKFPEWFDFDILKVIKQSNNYTRCLNCYRLRNRVLDYLSSHMECNTHSLRYAFINHMLTDLKQDMNVVAKFVGHTSVNQLVTYTQNKQVDAMFQKDI